GIAPLPPFRVAMKREGATLLLFVGGVGGSPVEVMLAGAQYAVALDTLDNARAAGAFAKLLLVTDAPALAEQAGAGVTVELREGPFHFGRGLAEVIHRPRIARPLYLGGGGLPLLDRAGLADLAARVAALESGVIANNLYSADAVGFAPGAAIAAIAPPARDNA